MVLSPAPIAKTEKAEEPVKRSLAYEQAISLPREVPDDKKDAGTKDIPDFETVTEEVVPDDGGGPPAVQDIPADGDTGADQDFASLPDESADAQDMAAVPPMPGEPGSEQWGTDDAEQWGDERRPPNPYANQRDPYAPPPDERYARQNDPYAQPGDPYREDEPYDPYAPGGQQAYGGPAGDPSAARRYGDPNGDPYAAQRDAYGPPQGDPYAAQRDAYGAPQGQPWGGDQNAEQWVQVIISGSGMRSTASEEAPILFAFPQGRTLKVVSRNEGWVEVTDPKSSTTGWMEAYALRPSAPPGQPAYGQNEAYYDEEPRERPGIFRRGGISDMINRAFGGGGN